MTNPTNSPPRPPKRFLVHSELAADPNHDALVEDWLNEKYEKGFKPFACFTATGNSCRTVLIVEATDGKPITTDRAPTEGGRT